MLIKFKTPVEISDNSGRQYEPKGLVLNSANVVAVNRITKERGVNVLGLDIITNVSATVATFVDGKYGLYVMPLTFRLEYETVARCNLVFERLKRTLVGAPSEPSEIDI